MNERRPPWIEADRVSRTFARRDGTGRDVIAAVRGVSFSIGRGESVALVGSSGSGKSTLARIVAGLDFEFEGEVRVAGITLDARSPGWRARRHALQMIFQDPAAALNPRHRARSILAEVREYGRGRDGSRASDAEIDELLTGVGLSPADRDKFPHEFSGGQKQRLSLARALAAEPDTLVADEPLSALDVSVQAQILALLNDWRRRRGWTLLFVTHDLAIVPHVAERVLVMERGGIVEDGPVDAIFRNPKKEATIRLLEGAKRGSTGP